MKPDIKLRSLKLDLTSRCNLGCQFCMYHGTHGLVEGESELGLDDYRKLLDELSTLDPKPVIKIAGSGEPTLFRQFDTLLELARSMGFSVRLITNGTTLQAKARVLAENLSSLIVSIHGPPETHDELTKMKGSYHLAIGGIRRIRRLAPKLDILLHMVLSPSNYLSMVRHAEQAEELGVTPRFQHLKFTEGNDELGDFDLEQLWDEMQRCREQFPDVVFEPDMDRRSMLGYYDTTKPFILNRHSCWRVLFDFPVHFDGEVFACDGTSMGNVREKPIHEIIFGEERRTFVARVQAAAASDAGLLDYCSRCCYNSIEKITRYSS